MIIATSQSYKFDTFPVLLTLMNLLGQFRNYDDQVEANKGMNELVVRLCGAQERTFRFKGARLEAEASKTHPDSITTGMQLTFMMIYDGADGYEQIQLFHVTSDEQARLTGELYVPA